MPATTTIGSNTCVQFDVKSVGLDVWFDLNGLY